MRPDLLKNIVTSFFAIDGLIPSTADDQYRNSAGGNIYRNSNVNPKANPNPNGNPDLNPCGLYGC